jgi:xylan 1,4-beta-xylosidase
MTKGGWRWLAGLLALASPAQAQTPATVHISVDATVAGTPLLRVWAFHGYDEINYATTSEGEVLLRNLVAAHSAPVHVRNHFLLNTGDGTPAMKWGSTNVYTEDADGIPIYSWTLTDGIMDAITAAGAFPLVEIGFMPQALSRHPTPYRNSGILTLDGGCFYPPTDYNKWAGLVRAWALHANGRYPNVEARWLWELWNEPDIGYWRGTFAEYAKLYDYTESALHEVLPNAALGGPAVVYPDGSFLGQFLEHCAAGSNAVTGKTGTRLDLVTFHAKGGVALTQGHVQMDLGNQLRLHRSGFAAVAAFAQFQKTPIYITEADPDGCAACPASSDPANAYRNSTAYGAYEIALMKHTLELAAELGVNLGGVLTWAFTFPGTPYFAGYRALATNGIHLPVLGAFELLGRLDGTRVPLTSSGARALDDVLANGVRGEPEVDGMATLAGAAIRVLVWSYHDEIATASATPVHLTISVPSSFGRSVRVSHLRVDELHGDAYTVWVAQGMPQSPSAAEIAALQQAMEPAPLVPDGIFAVAADGSVGVHFDLPRFGVSLVTVEPAPGTNQGWAVGGGCSCDVRRHADHAPSTALFGMGALALFLVARRPPSRRRALNQAKCRQRSDTQRRRPPDGTLCGILSPWLPPIRSQRRMGELLESSPLPPRSRAAAIPTALVEAATRQVIPRRWPPRLAARPTAQRLPWTWEGRPAVSILAARPTKALPAARGSRRGCAFGTEERRGAAPSRVRCSKGRTYAPDAVRDSCRSSPTSSRMQARAIRRRP